MKTIEKTITTIPQLTANRVEAIAVVDLKTVTGGCAACGNPACGGAMAGQRRWR